MARLDLPDENGARFEVFVDERAALALVANTPLIAIAAVAMNILTRIELTFRLVD